MIIYNAWDLEPADKVVLVSDLKEYVSKAMHDFHAREELFELIKEVPNEKQTTNQA